MTTIANGSPAKFTGKNPVYNGKTCTIIESYTATTGEPRYRVRWDAPIDRDLLQSNIDAHLLSPILVERLSVLSVPPAVGARVRGYEIPGFTGYEGQEVVVTEVNGSVAFAEFKSIQKPDDTVLLGFKEYEVVSVEAPEEVVAAVETADDRRHAELQAKITELEADTSRMSSRINSYCEDIDTIGRLLLEEAERRDWCSDYDDFVEAVNGALNVAVLPVREQEFEIVMRGTATVCWSRNVMVTARNEEDAVSMVEDDPSLYVDIDDEATAAIEFGWDANEVEEVATY